MRTACGWLLMVPITTTNGGYNFKEILILEKTLGSSLVGPMQIMIDQPPLGSHLFTHRGRENAFHGVHVWENRASIATEEEGLGFFKLTQGIYCPFKSTLGGVYGRVDYIKAIEDMNGLLAKRRKGQWSLLPFAELPSGLASWERGL